jgi:NitT/TauT family transport system permease protein
MIFAGLKLGLGVALLLIVAAEMIGAKSGIGYLIWTSYEIFDLEQMYVGLILMMFFGALSNAAMNELENRVVPWKHD